MRILYLATHQLWPLNSGNRIRNFHLARELAKHATVTFVEMCQPKEEPSEPPTGSGLDEIISLRRSASYGVSKIVRGLVGPTPLPLLNYYEHDFAHRLGDLVAKRRFDTVQVEGVQLALYLPSIQAASEPPEVLVDWHNIESELMERYSEKASPLPKRVAAKRTAMLLERAETKLLRQAKAHTVVSEREREKLLTKCPSAHITVVPNGIDSTFFSGPQIPDGENRTQSAGSRSSVLFVGSMDYHANIDGVTWFAREVWPTITAKYPDLEFVIVGRSPSKEVLALATDRIRVTGTVDDVRDFYASAIAAVVPLRVGGGTRLKILEAMGAGVPVISTALGAEGLEAVPNADFLLADTPAKMVEAIAQIRDISERERITCAGREFAVKHYDWSIIGDRLFQAHLQMLLK